MTSSTSLSKPVCNHEDLLKAQKDSIATTPQPKDANFHAMPTDKDSYYKFCYKKITCLRLQMPL